MINFVRRGSNVGDWVLKNHFLLRMRLFRYSQRSAGGSLHERLHPLSRVREPEVRISLTPVKAELRGSSR
jgi:hypothetical protein